MALDSAPGGAVSTAPVAQTVSTPGDTVYTTSTVRARPTPESTAATHPTVHTNRVLVGSAVGGVVGALIIVSALVILVVRK